MKWILITIILLALTSAAFAPVIIKNCPALNLSNGPVETNYYGLEKELPVINAAAERNNCRGKLRSILYAIRKAENGGPGFEFGVVAASGTYKLPKACGSSLNIQAGWAAATVVKNATRFQNHYSIIAPPQDWGVYLWAAFIDFLGDKYCPAADDPQENFRWKKNVEYWFEKFQEDNQ
jgi:hypothetical protein